MLFYTIDVESETEKSKIEQIYEKYHLSMFKRAYQILEDQMLAEDAVHESFVKLIRNLSQVPAADSPYAKRYCLVILEHTAIDMRRKKAISREYFYTDAPHQSAVFDPNPDTPMEDLLTEAIKNLPILYRDVILLRYSADMTTREVAKCLNISEDSVRTRISRAKKMLRTYVNGGNDSD